MTATDTYLALLRRVLTDRDDDFPRLLLADWWEENGEPERAELIRVQCELHRLPPKPVRLGRGMAGASYMTPAGPDYWTFTDDDTHGLKPGDRVDVLVHPICLKGSKPKVMSGLAVVRVEDQGSDGVRFTVKRDAESKRWPGAGLVRRERDLLDVFNGIRFLLDTPLDAGIEVAGGGWMPAYSWEWSRGFVSRVTLPAADWLRIADEIYWHPEQTAECPNKCFYSERHRVRISGRVPGKRCDRCKDGRVPRECPPTAQPLERVTLTTWPADDDFWGCILTFVGNEITCDHWPGITFRVAPPGAS